ncbi:MAG TPA: biotin/lipoate A/B protein ligase family protein [Abditibacteriaceae bacterium]|jgi:lipoate-protein ligase A
MQWRLIRDGAARGAWNMAVDEAMLLGQLQASTRGGTLRFYGWSPPCLSLGRFQRWDEVLDDAPTFDVVRRPTGGRAVWHHHEITYCAVLREEMLPRGSTSVAGAYAWLSRGFIAGLQTLGVQATLAPAGNDRVQTPDCFASATRADFVVDGRKLLGAAQCRHNGVVLQHGSLLLSVDQEAWQRALGNTHDVVTLQMLGIQKSREEIVDTLCAGCEHELGISLSPGILSDAEATLATRLLAEKYAQPAWNRERRAGAAEQT